MLPLLFALLLQDADLETLVRRLGDSSADLRTQAADQIEARGPGVAPALQKALDDADREVRDRAKDILFRLEPTLFLDDLIKTQRPLKLQLPTVPHRFWGTPPVIDGGWFVLGRRIWTEKGVVTGTVINTDWWPQMSGEVSWDVVSITSGCEIPVLRCRVHGPSRIFVPAECTDPVTVRIRGVRRWVCDVPVTFRFPKQGEQRRVGPYTVTLNWPSLEIVAGENGSGAAGIRSGSTPRPRPREACAGSGERQARGRRRPWTSSPRSGSWCTCPWRSPSR